MNWKTNLLKDLKGQYIDLLSTKYSEAESRSLFEILIENFFSISRTRLALEPNLRLNESEILKLHMAIKELLNEKPVQYITGISHFHDLKLKVNESVLIPRPETEELVSLVLENEKSENLRVIDIGTGSGCIAIVLKKELANADITAIDISLNALNIASANSEKYYLNIAFRQIDIFNTDAYYNLPIFDIVVSNPPYVTHSDKEFMKKNVLDHEPHKALFVEDNNPLAYYYAILTFCKTHLKSGGRVYFEIHESKDSEILQLLYDFNYKNATIHLDIHNKKRFVSAHK